MVNPAAASSPIANAPSVGRAPSFGVPGASVPSSSKPHPNAPAASDLQPSAIDHGLAVKGARSGAVGSVASVGLSAMENGLVKPKTPVAPITARIETIRRPAEQFENCGDSKVFVACPKLKDRYTPYTPFTPEAP